MLLNPQFTFEKVRFDQTTDLHLVVSVTAPKSDWQTHRPPLCIIPAVDRSGSMRGEKMAYTKRSLLKLIEHLTADDTLGLVSFATDSTVDFPAEKMTPDAKARAKKVVDGYRDYGNTFLSGGLMKVLEIVSDFDVEEIITGEARIKIPHILSEETIDIVIKAKLAAQKHPGPRQVNAVSAKLSCQVLGADGKMQIESAEGNAKVQFVKAGEEQTTPTRGVDELVARAQLLQVQNQAEAAAQRGDYAAAGLCFDSMDASFSSRGLGGVAAASHSLRSKYTDQHVYAKSAGSRMGLNRGLNRARAASAMGDKDLEMLCSLGISNTTSAQDGMMRSFQEPTVESAVINNPPGTIGLDPPKEEPVVRSPLTKRRTTQW